MPRPYPSVRSKRQDVLLDIIGPAGAVGDARYLRDPLFVFCFVLYFVNRWVLKPWRPNTFSRSYLNDLICIPFWVPIMLWMRRRLRLRADDAPPRASEILIPLILWSAVFELWVPRIGPFRTLAFSDHVDILFYALGALLAALFWKCWYRGVAPMRYPGESLIRPVTVARRKRKGL